MKTKLFITAGVVVTIAGLGFAGTIDATDSRDVIVQQEDAAFDSSGNYEHRPAATKDGITSRVDEYQHPDGSKGYVIYEWRTNANKSVDQRITSYDKDVASTGWVKFDDPPFKSSTSTPL